MNWKSEKNTSKNLRESEKENTIQQKSSQNTYAYEYSRTFTKIFDKLYSIDKEIFEILRNKMNWIRNNPHHKFKTLRNKLKGKNRIHVGHFVLIFRLDHNNKKVYFDDYAHHDKI